MKIDIDILLNKIHQKLDARGEAMVDEWLDSNPTHREYFEKLKKLELNQDNKKPGLSEEKQQQYRQAFINRINSKKTKKNTGRRILYAVSIASIILIIISINLFTNEKQEINKIASAPAQSENKNNEFASFEKTPKRSNKKIQLITSKGIKLSLLELDTAKYVDNRPFQLSEDKMDLKYTPSASEKEIAQGLNTLLVDRGAELRVTLSDGTKIHLNSDSELKYPTTFDNEKERRVFLTGEAYFDVTKNETKPFIVCTGNTEVKVLGTEFNINSRKPECLKATLVTGAVTLKSDKMGEEVKLKPGLTAIVNPETGIFDITDKDIQCFIGWKTGNYLFEQMKLSDILNELAIWYDLSIDYQTDQVEKETFTGSLSRDLSIEKLINIIERTNYLSIELIGKKLIVNDLIVKDEK